MQARTVFSSSENQAPRMTSLCPANDLALNPSTGSRVYSLAVMSREVVKKYLSVSVRLINKVGMVMVIKARVPNSPSSL